MSRRISLNPALLVHLANVRDRANAARWRGVEPVTRSALMSWVVRHRWARTTVEQRRAVGIALARAHWKHPDPAKIAPGGGTIPDNETVRPKARFHDELLEGKK